MAYRGSEAYDFSLFEPQVIKQPEKTTCVTYTITVTKGGNSESITLSSIVPGMYINR